MEKIIEVNPCLRLEVNKGGLFGSELWILDDSWESGICKASVSEEDIDGLIAALREAKEWLKE